MGLAWQQGPLSGKAVGRFFVAQPLPERLLFAERLRRRMCVRFCGEWIADSEEVLLHEPGHYPVAYFPVSSVYDGSWCLRRGPTTRHRELGETSWFSRRTAPATWSEQLGSAPSCPAMPRS
ncbi:DUF427 domain-containing protein [Micromonospora azadirachtae]|uniref:DUF427 domain-containing protein n=1 Tax=Micromonospora azadirachtae TaxID=1970735 RepID=A0ABW2ZWM7_9ACTN